MSRSERARQTNSVRVRTELTFHTNIVKLSARCSPRHLVHFVPCYYRMKIRLGNFSDAMLSAQSAFSVLWVRLCARMNSVRWPTRFCTATPPVCPPFEIRIPDCRVDVTCSNSTILGRNLFFPSFLSIFSCLFLSGSRFVWTDGNTSGVSPIIRSKHEWNFRDSWSCPIAWPCFFEPHLTRLPFLRVIDCYVFIVAIDGRGVVWRLAREGFTIFQGFTKQFSKDLTALIYRFDKHR